MLILFILRAHVPPSSPPFALALVGSAALSTLLLLVAPAVRDALALLDCTRIVVSASDAAVLDGGPAAPPPGSPPALVTLSVLASDPEYVCWAVGGSHLPAGAVAALTLFAAGAALPTGLLAAAVVFFGLAREAQGSSWVAVACAAWRRFYTREAGLTSLTSRPPASCEDVDFPGAATTDSISCASGLAVTPVVGGKDRPLQPGWALPWLSWLADAYRPRWWPVLLADIALAVVLAALAALVPRPTTALAIAGKASGICVTTLGLSAFITATRPYARSPEHAWKQPVRVAMLAVSAAAAIVVAWGAAIDARGMGTSDAETTGLAVVSYATCAGFGAAITLAVWDALDSLLLRKGRLRVASIMARVATDTAEPPTAEWGAARAPGKVAPRQQPAAPMRGRLLELAPVADAAVTAVRVSPLRRFADRVAATRAAGPSVAASEEGSAQRRSDASPSQAPLEASLSWAHIALDSARVHGANTGARVDVATVLRRPLSTRSPDVLLQQGQRIGSRRGLRSVASIAAPRLAASATTSAATWEAVG